MFSKMRIMLRSGLTVTIMCNIKIIKFQKLFLKTQKLVRMFSIHENSERI